MILDQLVTATKKRIERQQQQVTLAQLKAQVAQLPARTTFPFETQLGQPGLAVIGELKKASPSKGLIATDFPYQQIARDYEQAGVAAISVLTEPDYFQGNDQFLPQVAKTVKLPLLRKDFTVAPYMIYQARLLGASAILLIVAILTDQELRADLALADQLGLSALVEAHDAQEIKRALAAGARVIGVNNRNLKDFSVDLENSIQLRQQVPADVLFVAESGIKTATDIARLKAAGIDAVLIGETLMRATDKAVQLQELGV
ncbi:indole-3-glycerol phosphate synthase TrpC [Loigolactobacillus jiayinensis]|uniref:Indole-3-glycerol phosphate synthase n=1 Tax=Loigolactobacillus jiayinensis TaxID=2486016 RepID=A0ABW1R8Y8_9LACO|nr:indole-3-glycerol phosphate synthase TrpC [Loigolactobacillus jiayinensis]